MHLLSTVCIIIFTFDETLTETSPFEIEQHTVMCSCHLVLNISITATGGPIWAIFPRKFSGDLLSSFLTMNPAAVRKLLIGNEGGVQKKNIRKVSKGLNSEKLSREG